MCSFDGLSLFELLDVELTRCQVHLLTAEVLNSETYPAELDCIELLDFVVKFALRVLEGADHEPESIDGLFLSSRVSMLDIETLCNDEDS